MVVVGGADTAADDVHKPGAVAAAADILHIGSAADDVGSHRLAAADLADGHKRH